MDWPTGDVVVDGVRIHWTRTGGEGPRPIVLAHGFSDSGPCWTRVARELTKDYDVVMYDARGHGESDAPDEGYATDDHARDLAGLISALGLQRPAAIGHSMGAGTVAAVAGMPGVLSCAILEDPGWTDTPLRGASRPSGMAVLPPQEERPRSVEEIAAAGRKQSPTWHEDEFGAWALSKTQLSAKVRMGGGRQRKPWRETAQAVTVPTLLVAPDGTRPGLVTRESAEEAARIQPLVRAVTIPGTGHNVRRENFDGFVAEVRRFLGDVYPPAQAGSRR